MDLSNWLLDQSEIKYDKRLDAHRGEGIKPKMHIFPNEFDEAKWIAIDIKERHYLQGSKWSERMTTQIGKEKFEVAGIGQIGPAYIFVRDRNMNKLEHIKGKKFAVLHYDYAQTIMVNRVEAVPVNSEISSFIRKFNQGEVDIVAVPAYAFQPLEVTKGLGQKGAMINFPVVNVTADLIIRPDKFPEQFAANSRQWFVKQLPP